MCIRDRLLVTPVAVTGVGLSKSIGTGTATIAPVTVVSGTGLTTTSPIAVEGLPLSKSLVAPTTISGPGKGTTVIAPMNPIVAGEGLTVIADEDAVVPGKEEVLVTITNRATRQQLDEFKRQLKEKGLELNFDDIDYN